MPSKLQHEIDKLRGKIAETGQVYKDTMADLEDQVDAVSKNILAVETDLKGSIRKTKSDAKSEASHAASSSLPSSGGSMSGEIDMQGHDITGISDFEAEDSGGIGFYNESSVLTLGIDSSGNLTPQGTTDGRDLVTDGNKLDLVENNADVTDATNVNSAGAVMESDFTNRSVIVCNSAGAPSAITVSTNHIVGRATAAVGALAASQVRGIINVEDGATADQTDTEIRDAVEAATDSNTFKDADHTKLNAIESSATADQTNTEIRDAVEAATDSNTFKDADHTKLNAIESSATADQTDTEIKTAVENAADITIASTLKLNNGEINRIDGDVDNAVLSLNYNGYLDGVTRFRDMVIYDGKHNPIISFDGSTKNVTIYGNITTAYNVDGRDISADGATLDSHGASNHTDRARTIFVSVPVHTTGTPDIEGISFGADAEEVATYILHAPSDYVSFTALKVIWMAETTPASALQWVIDTHSDFASVGQNYRTHLSNDNDNNVAVGTGDAGILKAFTVDADTHTNLVAGDNLNIQIKRDGDHGQDTYLGKILIRGILLEYVSDE